MKQDPPSHTEGGAPQRRKVKTAWSELKDLEQFHREEAGRILATLIRLLGDFDLAEESLQEAYAVALRKWPVDGPPANPRAS